MTDESPQASTGGSIMPEAEEENPSPEMQGRSLAAPKRRGLAAAMVNQARGRWGRAKHMLLAASRVRRLALADNADFTRENTQALDAAVKGHINVVLNVEQTRDLSSINYAQQGNAAMYTPEVMSKRHSNRTDTSLIEVVRHWWRWLPKAEQEVMEVAPAAPALGRSAAVRFAHDSLPLPEPTAAASGGADTAAEAGSVGAGAEGAGAEGGSRTLQSRMSIHTRLDGGSGGVALDSGEASAGGGGGGTVLKVAALDRAIYSAMVVAITMVLLPRFGLKADPDYDPSEDWLDDNKGLPYMDFPNFFDAMFELADMWAEGTDVREYVELLLTTLHDVQKMDAADGTFSRLLKTFGYKSAFRPARESLFPPEPPPPPPPPPPEPKRAPSPQSEPSRPARTIPQHAPIRTDHVASRVASHIRSFSSSREPRSQQGSGNWEGWDAAAGAAAGADEGGENAQAGAQQQHPDAHMFSYGGGNHGGGCGPLPGSPPPDYGGVGGSGYGAAGAGGRWSPRRRGPFVMPAPAKVDYSGIRSTLAELTAPPRRPDTATLGEWRRLRQQRQQQRLVSARLGGKEQGVGGIPLALKQAEVADPGAAGSGAVGGPGRGPGPVIHAYEEYMHDMAARYLSTQEALLVATSAAAAAAAEQVLAAAGWAQQAQQEDFDVSSVYPQRLWDSADLDPAAAAAAASQQAVSSPRLPALSAPGSGQVCWPPRAPGAGTIGSSGASPQASPRASGTVPSAGTTAAASNADAAANQGQATAVSDPALVASPSGSAGLTSRASRLGSRALLSCGASSHSLPATPRGGVSITVGPDATAAGGAVGTATLMPPPALPQLWGPPLDPHATIAAITGRPVPATGAAAAAAGAEGGAVAAAALAAECSIASLAPSSLGPGGASGASTARSLLSRRGPPKVEGEPAATALIAPAGGETEVEMAARMLAFAPQMAGSDTGGLGVGHMGVDAAAAAAQAEVVVAFAQAAYRLADPNVHSLLLPSRVQPSGTGPHFPAHTAGARGHSGRRSPQRAISPPGAPGGAGVDAGRPGTGRSRCGPSRVGRAAASEGRERFAAYLQAPGAAAASAAAAARTGGSAVRGEAGSGAAGWGWAPGCDSCGPDAPTAAAAGEACWSCGGVEVGARGPQPTDGSLSGGPLHLHRAATADPGSLSRRPGSSPTPDYWFRPGHVAASSSERAATTAAALLGGAVSRRLCTLVSTSASCDLGSAGAGAGGGLPVGRTASGSNWFSAVPQLRLPGASGGSVAAGSATAPCSPGPGVASGPLLSPHSATAPSNASGSPVALSPSCAAGTGAMAGWGSPSAAAHRRPGMLGSRAGGGGGVWGYGGGRMSARGGGTAANGSGGGVVMPHGSMSNKLRTFYTTAPSGVVTPDGHVMMPPAGYTAAAGAAAEGAAVEDGAEGGAESQDAAAAQGHGTASVDRRHHGGSVPPMAAAVAAADAGINRGALRSPLAIRSSEPVGFSDAVTAARLNVAIMADELSARLADQRTVERQQRLAVGLSAVGGMRQGPAAGAAREAVRSSFGAFMAAREAAAAGAADPAEAGDAYGEGCAAE